MSKTFGSVKGSGTKDKAAQYKFNDGENSVRLFGNILPRYVYWIKGENNKAIPFECLAFDRDVESFTNEEVDYVKEFFPDLKCQWAYSMMCLNERNEPEVFNFKKKLFDQIMDNVGDLGDPADPETGWTLKFQKRKTGPLPINVEYSLLTIKCMNSKGPLTESQREIISKSKTIEEIIPRPKAEDQKKLLERLARGDSETVDEETTKELEAE